MKQVSYPAIRKVKYYRDIIFYDLPGAEKAKKSANPLPNSLDLLGKQTAFRRFDRIYADRFRSAAFIYSFWHSLLSLLNNLL